MTSKLNIPAIKDLAEALKANPTLLFSPELSFLKAVLSQYGDLKMPAQDHSHSSHGHAHEHGAGCCSHGEHGGHEQKAHGHQEHAHDSHDDHDDDHDDEDPDPERLAADPGPYLPVPAGGEDFDGAAAAKDTASDAKANGNYELAVSKFTEAMTLGSVSALTLSNRAECLLKLKKPCAAIADCTAALALNPDSAKALRCRGKAHRFLGKWEAAQLDLAAAQRIDFDPDTAGKIFLLFGPERRDSE